MQNVENFSHKERSIQELDIDAERVCLLDSEAPLTLQPSDKANFDFYVFGGILGNSRFIIATFVIDVVCSG